MSESIKEELLSTAENISPSGSYYVADILKRAHAEIERLEAELLEANHGRVLDPFLITGTTVGVGGRDLK